MRRLMVPLVMLVVLVGAGGAAQAQRACEYLVPPQGGAYEVPVHPAYVTSLRFAGKLTSANTSALPDKDYEIRPDGGDGLLVRPKSGSTSEANINVQVGTARISALLRTAKDAKEACALVTFKATTIEEAFERQVAEAVEARTAALKAEVERLRAEQAAQVAAAIDTTLAERAMARLELQRLKAVERNGDGVVVWVLRAVYLGPDLLLNVEVENRSGGPFRIAGLEVRRGGKGANLATAARMADGGSGGFLGVVAPGASLRGVVVVRDGGKLAGGDVALTVRTPDGKGEITVGKLGFR